jgi:hypothetical protein
MDSETEPVSDLDALRGLATHLLQRRYPLGDPRRPGGAQRSVLTLLPRAVPGTFPADVPLYPDGRLLGSMSVGEVTEVVIEADGAADAVIAWYRSRLLASGWTECEAKPGPPHRRGGFLGSAKLGDDEERASALFCQTPIGPSASVLARRYEAEPTAIHIVVDLTTDPERSPCTEGERARLQMERRRHMGEDVMPPIAPPPMSRQRPRGGGGSSGDWRSSAHLQSDLAFDDIVRHYRDQLEAGGWRHRDESIHGELAISRWAFDPEEGTNGKGYLFIISEEDGQDRYRLELRAVWDTGEEDSWHSSWA